MIAGFWRLTAMRLALSPLTMLLIFIPLAHGQSGPAVHDARLTLTEGASDSNPATRREVALALGLTGQHEPANELLRKLMSDRDVEVQVAAIGSVADLQAREFLPQLKTALDDDVPEVAFAAAKSLWAMHDPSGKEALLAVLDGDKRARSGFFARKYRGLMRAFSTPKGAILFAVDQGAGLVPFPGVGAGVSALQSLFSEKDFSARASVAIDLARAPGAETRDVLVSALGDDDWAVRAAAAQALGMRNDARLRGDLLPLLHDGNSKVRFRAAASYLRLSGLAGHADRAPATGSGRQSSH